MFNQTSLVKLLKDVRMRVELAPGTFEFSLPSGLGHVLGYYDTSRAPGLFRKATDFEDESPLFLAEATDLFPTMCLEAGKNGMSRQRFRIDQP
ncbi:MAG TPA: hypothetical protein VIT23_12265, partial [Terrimicrobiaceae bacterium]